jgi:hypothetical protein
MTQPDDGRFLVMYAKLTNVKRQKDICFKGPFLGGIVKDKKHTEKLIKRIIAEQKGFAILPKVFEMTFGFQCAYDEARREFKKMHNDILEADRVMKRR